MTDLTLESVAERLDRLQQRSTRLERQNRRLRILAAVGLALIVAVGAAAILLATARFPRTLAARRFVLRDADGRMRAELTMWKGEKPCLALYDAEAHMRVSLSVGERTPGDGPALKMLSPQGRHRASLTASSLMTVLAMSDDGGQPAFDAIVVNNPDHPGLALMGMGRGEEGEDLLRVRVVGDYSTLALRDMQGDVRAELGMHGREPPRLRIYDERGTSLFSAP